MSLVTNIVQQFPKTGVPILPMHTCVTRYTIVRLYSILAQILINSGLWHDVGENSYLYSTFLACDSEQQFE